MSAQTNQKTKKISKPTQPILVQFNQIKGKKTGPITRSHQWREDTESNLVELDM